MQATEIPRPFHHEGWVYEEKVDGYRIVAYKDGDELRLISRQNKDFTARFPELISALAGLSAANVHPRRGGSCLRSGPHLEVRVAPRAAQRCDRDPARLHGV